MPFRNGLRLAGQAVIERSAPGGKRRCPRWVCGNPEVSRNPAARALGRARRSRGVDRREQAEWDGVSGRSRSGNMKSLDGSSIIIC
jgi:hypothetical protein